MKGALLLWPWRSPLHRTFAWMAQFYAFVERKPLLQEHFPSRSQSITPQDNTINLDVIHKRTCRRIWWQSWRWVLSFIVFILKLFVWFSILQSWFYWPSFVVVYIDMLIRINFDIVWLTQLLSNLLIEIRAIFVFADWVLLFRSHCLIIDWLDHILLYHKIHVLYINNVLHITLW